MHLSPMHRRPQPQGARDGPVTYTRADKGGRISLPLCNYVKLDVAAERDGAVLRIFLPDATQGPRVGSATPPLRVDNKGRLLIGLALRHQLGMPDRAHIISRQPCRTARDHVEPVESASSGVASTSLRTASIASTTSGS
jgi:hypothetical protein